ncbi:Cro/CI family transcriptional regulator [Shewanella algae]|uniref:Cro/CI family transcriptional regulator n=1 Tax=Shewanella algae TaxID=38313 RepID=UPI003006364A
MTKSDVIRFFKTQQSAAEALSSAGFPISQAAISKWQEQIPPLWQYRFERITGGVLKAADLPVKVAA